MQTITDTIDKDGTITRTITDVQTTNISKEMYAKELERKRALAQSLPTEIAEIEAKIAEVESKQPVKEEVLEVEEIKL